MRSLLLASLVLLLSPPTSARSGWAVSVDAAWPAGAGPTGEAVTGHLTADLLLDVVVEVGGELRLLTGPAVYDLSIDLGPDATAMAIARRTAPTELAGLVVANGTGVHFLWLPLGASTFSQATIASGPDWEGGVALAAADLDGDERDDLTFLAADRVTVRTLMAQGNGAFVEGIGSTLVTPASRLMRVEWDGDADVELAANADLGLDVYDANGAHLAELRAFHPGGPWARLPQPSGRDEIAFVTSTADETDQFLTVLSPAGYEAPILLGGLDVVSAAAGDRDGDGDHELVVGIRSSQRLVVLENRSVDGGGSTFDLVHLESIDLTDQPDDPQPGFAATPVVADLDTDGSLDLLVPVDVNGTLVRADGSTEFEPRPIVASAFLLDVGGNVPGVPGEEGEPSTLFLDVEAPESLGAAIVAGATHLETVVWRQPSIDDFAPPAAHHFERVPLPESWPHAVGIPLLESEAPAPPVYFTEHRLVGLTESGAKRISFPASFVSFSTDPDAMIAFEEISPGVEIPTTTTSTQWDPNHGTPKKGSATVPREEVPIFDEDGNEVPRPEGDGEGD
ncbi:MAG: FG-GAP repeat domain-containing protein [Planctomycetota bacterium JB042]